jgi:putative hemolysin
MRTMTHDTGAARDGARRFAVELARDQASGIEAMRLRARVFEHDSDHSGLDYDHFDQFCDHLLVRDRARDRVAGTYRLLGCEAAERAGGFYSESEFDLAAIKGLPGRILEVGRACVDPAYRSGAVISALWAGLFSYIEYGEYDYVIGCGSVPISAAPEAAAATCNVLTRRHLSPSSLRVTPHRPFTASQLEPAAIADRAVTLPPLIKGYLRMVGWVCGEPAWDPVFDVADLLLLLPMTRLDDRYASHYRRATSGWQPPSANSGHC